MSQSNGSPVSEQPNPLLALVSSTSTVPLPSDIDSDNDIEDSIPLAQLKELEEQLQQAVEAVGKYKKGRLLKTMLSAFKTSSIAQIKQANELVNTVISGGKNPKMVAAAKKRAAAQPRDERGKLAKKPKTYKCECCGDTIDRIACAECINGGCNHDSDNNDNKNDE